MVFNFNRFFVGVILCFILFLSFILNLDSIFFFLLVTTSLYDLIKSKIISNLTLFFLVILIPVYYIYYQPHYYYEYIPYLLILLIILSLIFDNDVRYFFSFIIIIFLFFLNHILNLEREIIYLSFLIAFINDTSAYLFGKNLKGPLIFPSISPNKTWSGTISSYVITFSILYLLDFTILDCFILPAALFLGDLYFSAVKRKLSLKDFSNFLSEHGGILDRIDSIFLFIVLYYFNFEILLFL